MRAETNPAGGPRTVSAAARPPEEARDLYAGWVAGALVILGILAVGGVFWFLHHP